MTSPPRASGMFAALSPMVSALTLVLVAMPACTDPGPTPVIVDVIPSFAKTHSRPSTEPVEIEYVNIWMAGST